MLFITQLNNIFHLFCTVIKCSYIFPSTIMHDDKKLISLLASAFMGCKFPALRENVDTGLFMCEAVVVLHGDKKLISPLASAFMGCKFLA